MKTIMARNPHDSFSFSRRYFHWKKKLSDTDQEDDYQEILTYSSSSRPYQDEDEDKILRFRQQDDSSTTQKNKQDKKKKKKENSFVIVLRSAFTFGKSNPDSGFQGLGSKVIGTLFGNRRGHVRFAFQEDPKLSPALLVELAMSTSALVKEMASGLVRIALECDKNSNSNNNNGNKKMKMKKKKLLEEPVWRAYCNGRKCGYATRRECGPEEWKVLSSIGRITMGAGVIPGLGFEKDDGDEDDDDDKNGLGFSEGEVMYMRARFERVVGSKDSEAFYMINPDGHGGPELSIYLLRV